MREKFKSLKLIPNVLLDPRYAITDNFIGQKIPGYESLEMLLSEEAFNALKSVALECQKRHLKLKIFDAYRPIKAVEFFFEWTQRGIEEPERKKRFYPHLMKENLFKEGFLAIFSSHSRGSAVDLTLSDEWGNELDMGTEFDFFGEESHTFFQNLSLKQKENRKILYALMTAAGFENYSKEWWHFRLKNEPYPETYFDFTP